MHNLFVYGTLKRGGKLHGILRSAKFIGPTSIQGDLYTNQGSWYPKAVPGNNTIHGELYGGISEHLISMLDEAEGAPFLFERSLVKTGSGADAWVYWYKRPLVRATLVKDGVFHV